MQQNKTLSKDKIATIRGHFDFFDRDGNGSIDVDEFTELLLAIEPKAKREECLKGFAEVDMDGDGSIDFAEFLKWWETVWWQF